MDAAVAVLEGAVDHTPELHSHLASLGEPPDGLLHADRGVLEARDGLLAIEVSIALIGVFHGMLLAIEFDLISDDIDDIVVSEIELSADSRSDPAIPEEGPELLEGLLGKAAAGDEFILRSIEIDRRLDGGAVEGIRTVSLIAPEAVDHGAADDHGVLLGIDGAPVEVCCMDASSTQLSSERLSAESPDRLRPSPRVPCCAGRRKQHWRCSPSR